MKTMKIIVLCAFLMLVVVSPYTAATSTAMATEEKPVELAGEGQADSAGYSSANTNDIITHLAPPDPYEKRHGNYIPPKP
ncbi:hypothetical protein PAHAL_9G410900 [Panicum hallii]|jgi:hypothetical protein|uniref:Uncharacterized protein n=1 Tax=Panicum hallii TaxID=206008 RepID=A0A2S3IPA8_9POAL|nr:hypothetical protein PAHAL_9G410900 [Panicum hallii]